MNLQELQLNWDILGATDPLWSICSDPYRRGGKWNLQEFFETGQQEVADALHYLKSAGIDVTPGIALDFGCGVGRLTQGLCRHFERCYGVDIAPSMIRRARKLNRFGDRCSYLVNAKPDLQLFEDNKFDFVYSDLVLQHIAPEYSTRYVEEFIRVLRPGGIALFQVPSHLAEREGCDVATAPMPESGFRASINVRTRISRVYANETFSAETVVRNISDQLWRSPEAYNDLHALALGNHWLNESGEVLVMDDGRMPLDCDVPPGGEMTLSIAVTAPHAPGSYVLELDMLQEQVAWFGQKGSATARIKVDVIERAGLDHWLRKVKCRLSGSSRSSGGTTLLMPRMETHGLPVDEVHRLVGDRGGTILDIRPSDRNGPSWISFSYCVAKPR